jgi:hypothetical protein
MYEAFQSFYEQDNYHFAYLAAHILLMYQIYLRLWQLAKINPSRVIDALSMAHYDKKDGKPHGETLQQIVSNARSPMTFKVFRIDERVFVKTLTLLDCADYTPFKKAIDFRNTLAHPNALLSLRTEDDFDEKIQVLESLMKVTHSAATSYLTIHITNTMKKNRYSRPYESEEINNDVEQLLISPLMLSATDCALVSNKLQANLKIETVIKDYMKKRAENGGYTYETSPAK